jgi:hypothetical protein
VVFFLQDKNLVRRERDTIMADDADVFKPEWDAMKFDCSNLNVAVDWAAILLRIAEFPVWNLDPETGYGD